MSHIYLLDPEILNLSLPLQSNSWSVFVILRAIPVHLDPAGTSLDEFESACIGWIQAVGPSFTELFDRVMSGEQPGGIITKDCDRNYEVQVVEVPVPPEVVAARQMQAAVAGYQARRFTDRVVVDEWGASVQVVQAHFRGGAERDTMERWDASPQAVQSSIEGY